MLEKTRCDCGKTVSVTKEGLVARHWHNGMPCSESGKYADSIPAQKRDKPYLHAEPRLVGERTGQSFSRNPVVAARFRKKNWTSYNCCECGKKGWIKESRLIGIVKRGVHTLETLRCWDCRKDCLQESSNAVLEARKNLALRKMAMKGR